MTACLATAVSHVRIATKELHSCADFATRILGLQRSNGEGEFAAYANGVLGLPAQPGEDDQRFRADARYQTVVFADAATSPTAIGIELVDDRALETVEKRLEDAGHPARQATPAECARLAVRAALVTHDPSDNVLELVVGPRISGQRFFPARDTGIVGFQGVGLRSVAIERDLDFWTGVIGARLSDRIGDIAFLAIDDHHHRIALYPSDRAGLLNVAVEIESVDAIMQASYFLAERQVRIVQGPGKDAASEQVFLHVAGPGGVVFSLVSGMSRGQAVGRRPRQFARTRSAFCTWGSLCTDVPEWSPLQSAEPKGNRS